MDGLGSKVVKQQTRGERGKVCTMGTLTQWEAHYLRLTPDNVIRRLGSSDVRLMENTQDPEKDEMMICGWGWGWGVTPDKRQQ